ncbi:hypothetical protein EAH68_10905 [Corynebacterium hylobatis]|uniref:CAP domain-containing protein n=1 Tax=Corynebacterium hylobatis TaxID=1859290 RepID=A0A430HX80_9CORY|nr:hypothetical protein [Corynebacterium hylobatis]RSZ61975.1 hypothetical protein EAH68_10905 [Corynebacterium hylobatis]
MRKITRSLTAVAVATTVAFAGTGVASAASSDIKLGNLFSSSKISGVSSKQDEHKLSEEEEQIWDAAKAWAEAHELEQSEEALKNAQDIHKLAVEGEYEDFDIEGQGDDGMWVGMDFDKGTFLKVAEEDLDVLLEFLERREAANSNDGYGLVVSSDEDNYYLTIGISNE